MDMKWDEYVDMFGFTPAEYIGSPAYKAKYGENQVKFSEFSCDQCEYYRLFVEMLARSCEKSKAALVGTIATEKLLCSRYNLTHIN